jgi:prepilin-type N-terminal cleavage/methylation domain-containing protein
MVAARLLAPGRLAAVFGICMAAAGPQAQEENRALRIPAGFRLTFRYFHTMKPCCSNQRNRAFTLMELLVVIVVLAILLATIDFGPSQNVKGRAQRLNCVNNLHHIGIAYNVWAEDNDGKYPMQVSTTNGGSMELVAKGENVWINFLVMSNELSTPKVLYCTADADRVCATNFSSDLKGKISYFVGLDASTNRPQAFLSGDDNFAINNTPVKSGLLELSTNTFITWSSGRHVSPNSHFWTASRDRFIGNIGMADGSIQGLSALRLQQSLQQTGLATNRLAIP